eukprot:499947_1
MNSQTLTNANTSWCMQSKKQIHTTCRVHMLSRYCKIKSIIQQIPQLKHFELSQNEINRMLQDINNEIQSWKGVELELCTKKKTTFKQYNRTATNWYNRNKPKIFGNYFFYPLIFNYLLNHCKQIKDTPDNIKMGIFITIFVNIFEETIRFKKTKSQPLLPYQTVIQPNRFKDECVKLMDHYQIKLDLTSVNPLKVGKKYQKDAKRSQKISKSFKKAFVSIQQILKITKCSFYNIDQRTMNNYPCTSYTDYSNPNDTISLSVNKPIPNQGYISKNISNYKPINHNFQNVNLNNMTTFPNNTYLNDIFNANKSLINYNPISTSIPQNRIHSMEIGNKSQNKPMMVRYQVIEYKPVINEYTLML